MSADIASKILQLPPKRLALLALELHQRLESVRESGWPIAIVGAACRLPGDVSSPEAFWSFLLAGKDAVGPIPEDRWDVDGLYNAVPGTPGRMYTREGGFLSSIDRFDAAFFGISAREASHMDPQHRLLLEAAWQALEQAGQSPHAIRGSATGVFVGITTCDYTALLRESGSLSDGLFGIGGAALNAAPGRVSYNFGFHGPSVAVDTACSSSLVAVHQACSALAAGDCDLALAGGVNLILTPDVHILASQARMLARDGRCKTFDRAADGFGRSEGCVLLVLKRLADAVADRDSILALVAGSAVNHGGASGGFSVPNPKAQTAVIVRALQCAGIDAREVGFVETHGTGTALGDPLEVRALADALAACESGRRPVWLGALKSNIGHAESAAGAASLLKAALAVYHGTVPGNLHCISPNPAVDWATLPFHLPREPTPWPAGYARRVAGVSSFGMSGTNAHAILAAPPDRTTPVRPLPARCLLPLSARSAAELRTLAARYADYLDRQPSWPDVCFTAAMGGARLDERLAVVAGDAREARDLLRAWLVGEAGESRLLGGRDDEVWDLAAAAYASGNPVSWPDLWSPWEARRTALPPYRFDRQRHWIAPGPKKQNTIPSLYRPVWERISLDPPARFPGRWLLVGTEELPAGSDGIVAIPWPSGEWTMIPPGPWSGVIVLLPPGPALLDPAGEGPFAAEQAIRRLLGAARWMERSAGSFPFWFATCGAQPVDGAVPGATSAAWGFIRTLAIENANRKVGLCDLDPAESVPARYAPLLRLAGTATENQLAVRRGQAYALRIAEERATYRPFYARPDRTYLIAGGLGGVGEICARTLVERGARHVVLTGKRALDAGRQARLEALFPAVFVQSDVASPAGAAELFAWIRGNHPPLVGIVHAALFLDDRPAASLTGDAAQAVLSPKTAGTWNLHLHSLDQSLDFFLLLSSASGIFGNGGQSAYAAGNAFQDAFAHARRAAGLPALSVNLGPVEDTGAIRRIAARRQLPPFVHALSVADTARALEVLLSAQEAPQYVLCALDRKLLQDLSDAELPPILRDLRPPAATPSSTAGLAERLACAVPANREHVLRNWQRELAAAVLGQPPASLEPDRPLQQYGLDSLLSLELRNRLATGSGLSLPASLLFDYPTLDALAKHFRSLLFPPEAVPGTGGFTEDEAAALLEQMASEVLRAEEAH